MGTRTLRTLTIAVWALVSVVLVGLAFVSSQPAPTVVRSPESTGVVVFPDGASRPVVYEFSTDS
jgi:hypothetical protein